MTSAVIGIASSFGDTLYTESVSGIAPQSAASSEEVPHTYPVALAGHGYLLDNKTGAHRHETTPLLRPGFVQDDELGEKNINPESLWRVSQNSWHKGAGQVHLDRPDSDPARFRTSKGVDPWTQWQISLLPDTDQARASANTNLRLAVAGGYLYVLDGNALLQTTDLTAFTAVTGTPAATALGIASDGNNLYVAFNGQGLWTTTRGAAAATQLITGTDTFSVVGYVKGRLLVAKSNALYNWTTSTPGVLGAAMFTHPNPDFAWVGFAGGSGFIYAAGYSGDKSFIYRVGIEPDGTALGVPVQAGQLPDGEIIRSISSYLGVILLGTDNGVRLAAVGGNGDLQIGALIPTGACHCFEPQDRFVWFGWNNYDTTSTGLGRVDLTVINDDGSPAYASDLMVTGQGIVTDVVTLADKRVFTVNGLGVYVQSPELVAQGNIDSGLISYDLPDDKLALYLTIRYLTDTLFGEVVAYVAVDGDLFLQVAAQNGANGSDIITLPELLGETFQIREVLVRDPDDATLGPVIIRHTLEANPSVDTGYFITVPLLLVDKESTGRNRKPDVELAFLKSLRASSARVVYQEAQAAYTVTIDNLIWVPDRLTEDKTAFNGTCVLKLKSV